MGRRRRQQAPFDGVLVVDKERGPTSHDVVARARRALGTSAIGHAGTLDPMATGVLVLAVGQATKLVPWLTAADKAYEARLRLGVGTDSHDADGEVVTRAPVPPFDAATLTAAARAFLGPHRQFPPALSAIRVDGKRLHERVRAGEEVEVPARDVVLHEVEAWREDEHTLGLRLRAAKGFYVRSFGRDLAARLGTCGHLVALRRTASGAFDLEGALPSAALAAEGGGAEAGGARLGLAEAAAKVLPTVEVDGEGAKDAAHGRPVLQVAAALAEGEEAALLHQGALIAVARRDGERLRVVRGFPAAAGASA
ncbi:MAG: tRNA pseudouridine(55) synthase TruB [Myxococcota bacterium]